MMELQGIGKTLVIIGAIIVVVGLFLIVAEKINFPFFAKLPATLYKAEEFPILFSDRHKHHFEFLIIVYFLFDFVFF